MAFKNYLRDVELGPADVLGAALLCPGFCADLTTWRLTIDQLGLITQEIFLYCDPLYRGTNVTRTSQLTRDQLENLLQLAEEIEFTRLKEVYDEGADDVGTTTIVLSTADGVKRVYETGGIEDDLTDIRRYVRLWDAIVELAPTNSPAWRQEREQLELASHIEILKQRVREQDFIVPSVKQIIAAVLGVPAIVFAIQLFYPKFGRTMPELPTLKEYLTFSGIGYTVTILVWFYGCYQRRMARLDAKEQLAQFESENSEMIDLELTTER